MRSVDAQMMAMKWPEWARSTTNVQKIAILSPSQEEIDLLKKLFPSAALILHEPIPDGYTWNLDDKAPEKYDLVVASAVFMCAKDPQLWFDNILNSSRYSWIQDHILAWRTPDAECSTDSGDVMRYQWLPDHPARVPQAYDLKKLTDRTHEIVVYNISGSKKSQSFLIFLQGYEVI